MAGANKILEQTLINIQKVKKEHLVEIKSLNSPPVAVKTCLTSLVILCERYIIEKGGEMILMQD